jgi:hypothetical protein
MRLHGIAKGGGKRRELAPVTQSAVQQEQMWS